MFENISTLMELESARFEAIRSRSGSLLAINREYEEQKRKLLNVTENFKKIPIHRYNGEPGQRMMCIPWVGESSQQLTITYTNKGFLV